MTPVPVLETRALSKSFGHLKVTQAVDFALAPGAREAIIGPNGAGKSTFINLLTGMLTPGSGDILLDGRSVLGVPAERRVGLGLVRTFQINTLFRELTPLETLSMAIAQREGQGGALFRRMSARRALQEEAMALLAMFNLQDDAGTLTRELAYGRQRLLEMALAFALKPRVLLLDEPAAGIPARESGEMFDVIAALPREISILFIEHDMDIVFRFAERITVLVAGAVVARGTPAEIAADPLVRSVYLGS